MGVEQDEGHGLQGLLESHFGKAAQLAAMQLGWACGAQLLQRADADL
jgi:hypothetical protein